MRRARRGRLSERTSTIRSMNVAGAGVMITGGASGLGLATAEARADSGARVVLVGLASSKGKDEAQRIGNGACFVSGDVTSEEDVQRAVDSVENLRVLVNCAGIGGSLRIVGRDGPYPLDKFRRVIEVNLIGTFNCLRLAASKMSEAKAVDDERGVIVNTASVAAFDGQIGQAAYSASKGGIVALSLMAAQSVASGPLSPSMYEHGRWAGQPHREATGPPRVTRPEHPGLRRIQPPPGMTCEPSLVAAARAGSEIGDEVEDSHSPIGRPR